MFRKEIYAELEIRNNLRKSKHIGGIREDGGGRAEGKQKKIKTLRGVI